MPTDHWSDRLRDNEPSSLPVKRLIAVALVAILALISIFQIWNGFNRAEPGFVTVVRNGGPLDDRSFRQILAPNDGMTWTGLYSTLSDYPTTERFDNVRPGRFGDDPAAGDDLATDFYRTRTKDGIDVGIQGQWKYVLNTDPKVLEQFDTAYGQRTYAVPGTDERVKVSDGDQGMAVFIAGQVRPVQQEALRQGIGDIAGEQLDPSIALLKSATADPAQAAAAAAALAGAPSNTQVFTDLSNRISATFADRINAQLGGPYLTQARFTLQAIQIAPDTQDTINRVRTVSAQVAEANAAAAKQVAEATGRAQAAAQDAQAQINRQAGYNACSVCADIDRIKAQGEALKGLPAGIQVYAPGADVSNLPLR
jgi:hypothetical protein